MKSKKSKGGIAVEGFSKISFLNKEALSQKYDADKEKELVERFQKGDMNAFREIRRAYDPIITKIAINAQPNNREVSLAQIKAVVDGQFPRLLLSYDPTKAQLNTHLIGRMSGLASNAVKDYMIGPHIPRPQQDELNRYTQALREARQTHGSDPNENQIFHFYKENNPDKTKENFLDAKKYHHSTTIGDAPIGQDSEDGGAPMQLKDKYTGMSVLEDPEDTYRMLELDRIQNIMREHLDDTEFNVIKDHKINGETMARVAIRYNMSTTRLRSILDKWDRIREEHNIT
jgi:DNA-directed RNA polymerase specialized sigma subunit